MDAIDRLSLRWQFESFTKEFQDQCWSQMLEEFTKAWKFKKNRTYIQQRIKECDKSRPDLFLEDNFYLSLRDQGSAFYADWSAFDGRKTKKEVYIGPEQYMCM